VAPRFSPAAPPARPPGAADDTPRPAGLFGPMNPRIDSWVGRRVWVVGASSGIGAEIARGLLRRGARVAVSARRADALRAMLAEGGDHGSPDGDPNAAGDRGDRDPGRARGATGPAADSPIEPPVVLPLDVTDADAVAAACGALRDRWGGLDLVVWVAGLYQPMRAQNFELGDARRMLETNFGAVLSGLAAVLPVLLAQRAGGIALVSSVAGYSGLPQALVYGPTKAALINLAESLYLDLRPAGIGVHLVNPGYVDTPATAGNAYAMPALISAREAADATLAGIERGHFEIHYPKRFTGWLKFARLLPYRLYFPLVHRVTGL
jgi:NAD(P)-dependent dehydrogenase (short-subunit alcohol dehydrogenase family)